MFFYFLSFARHRSSWSLCSYGASIEGEKNEKSRWNAIRPQLNWAGVGRSLMLNDSLVSKFLLPFLISSPLFSLVIGSCE